MKTINQELQIKLLPFLVTIAFFMQMLDSSILNTAIPEIAASMGEKPINLDVAVTAYMLSLSVFLTISGWLSDKFGIKRIFMIAVFIFTLGSLFSALSENLTQLTISRVLQGMGGAWLSPIGRLAVLKVYPREKYVNVISFIVLPALIGPLIGPTLGGFIVEYLSWHWIFLINIPVGILCCIATIYVMPDIPKEENPTFDFKGFLILDIAILFIFFSVSSSGGIPISKTVIFCAALVLILLYIPYARGKDNVLFNLKIFETRNFSIGIIGNLVIRLSGGALPFIGPLFLQTALNYSPSKSGTALIPLGLGAMFAKSFVAYLIKRFGYRNFMFVNTIFQGLFIACMALVTIETPFYIILIIFALIGISNSMQFTSINTLTMLDVKNKYLSESNTLMSVVMQVSLALGVSGSALLLDKFSGIGMALIPSFHIAYISIGIFTVISGVLFLFIKGNPGNI
ncbi:MAG: DHA2 family efflux MFS transporter permease subunit [Elusimicrobiota bacterium]|jgi:EmrB/QacA subfamily drug resistance transporter|nr:DHA2 family efflux MFS transporter permease subunit [Elusimicrobiota bacterium]